MRRKKVYLINPKNDFPNYYGAEVFTAVLGKPGVIVADLAVTTVATLMRPYFDVQLCDQHIDEVDYDLDVDFVAITGKVTQRRHAEEIAMRFRDRGIPVMVGGPFASLSPERVRHFADILIVGELEEIADEIFPEIASGKWKDYYEGEKADLANSPLPAWELYPNHRSLSGNLQVSRGCPFQCEFCDVIQYLGRKQRHKPVGNILRELDVLHAIGYTNSFISDDNFSVYRSRAKEVLLALEAWNKAVPGRTHKFSTQLSIDITRDEEMLDLLNRAGFSSVFVGIETINEESLREARKFQNTKQNLVDEVAKFYKHGITVYAGMIVGFDHDGPDIFKRQYDFAVDSSIPFFSLNYLVALESTPLFTRLKKAGRIRPDEEIDGSTQYTSNVRFKGLNEDQQYRGMRWLLSNLYAPRNYGQRLVDMIDKSGEPKVQMIPGGSSVMTVKKDLLRVMRNLRKMGREEAEMYERVMNKLEGKPRMAMDVMYFLFLYAQVRHMLDNQRPDRPMYVPAEVGREPFTLN